MTDDSAERLLYGLDRLAMWGISSDPRVRAECSRIAQARIEEVGEEVRDER